MQTYREFRPTSLDPSGLGLPDHQDWLVVPVMRTRDSGPLAKSNFETALKMLGGEGECVEIHRFGHYLCGWLEIVLVRPGSECAAIAEDIEAALADYLVLDDVDLSDRENEIYEEAWAVGGGLADGFERALRLRAEELWGHDEDARDDAIVALLAADVETLKELYDDHADPSFEMDGDNLVTFEVEVANKMSENDLAKFISKISGEEFLTPRERGVAEHRTIQDPNQLSMDF